MSSFYRQFLRHSSSYSPKKLRLVTNVVLLLQVSNVLCNSMKKNSLLLEPKRVRKPCEF